jgi:hypothetical protein
MVKIVLVGFLPDDHGRSCVAHPFGCGNALIEGPGNGVGRLVRLRLVERTHTSRATQCVTMAQMVAEFVSRRVSMPLVAWLLVLMVACSGSRKFFFRTPETVVCVRCTTATAVTHTQKLSANCN